MVQMFVVLLVFFGAAYWWANRKPAAPYNPSREDILILLRKVVGGMNTEVEWEAFTSVPIASDQTLEGIRNKAAAITAEPAYSTDLKEGFLFNEAGLIEIKRLITQLEEYCKSKGREKTVFQMNCAQMIEHKLQHYGLEFTKWDFINGPEESYYLGELRGVQVYVYGDGINIKHPLGSHSYDSANYKGEGELIRAMVGKLTELTSGSGGGANKF